MAALAENFRPSHHCFCSNDPYLDKTLKRRPRMPWTRPVILLSHGAWHEPELYDPLRIALSTRGYGLIVPRLATMGEGKTCTNWDAHVATLLDAAAPLFNLGRSVVLAAHSYGGILATIATQNNGVDERCAAGKLGGFSQLVLISSFAMPAKGMSVLSVSGSNWLPWHKVVDLQDGGVSDFHCSRTYSTSRANT